jgi:hypothetical protein
VDCKGAGILDCEGEKKWIHCQPPCKRLFLFFSVQFLNKEVFIQVIGGNGHHVYADQVNKFNKIVLGACMETDNRKSAAATARVGHHSPPNASAL